jgi:hypothetical protein
MRWNTQADANLIKLAGLVNARLTSVQVNISYIVHSDGSKQTLIVFWCGVHRGHKVTDDVLDEGSIDKIVELANDWTDRQPAADKWTEDLSEADRSPF